MRAHTDELLPRDKQTGINAAGAARRRAGEPAVEPTVEPEVEPAVERK